MSLAFPANTAVLWRRREWLVSAIGSTVAIELCAKEPQTVEALARGCTLCGGGGRVPVEGARPWVWTKGHAPPKWMEAIGEQACPICRPDAKQTDLVDELRQQCDAALKNNRVWEERTGWKLQCAITRHATVHTQLSTKQAREVGLALEALTLHLKRVTGSLAMTPTRPDGIELIVLLEKSSWDAFRKVMEGLYTPTQLGEAWFSAQRLVAYDHYVTPHLYETKETLRTRPPTCAATFIVARRQVNAASGWRAPFWLSEGFAAYGDYVVHQVNRLYSVYSGEQVPVGDWMAQARQLASTGKALAWSEVLQAELRDWRDEHHFQTMAIVAFLLESEPDKFLEYLRRLSSKEEAGAALEAAYRTTVGNLEKRWSEWILARR